MSDPKRAPSLLWLGSPRVELDGAPLRFETRKALALLAYLSDNEGPQRREVLADLLWPDFGPERAPANLRRALFSLGRVLGTDRFEAGRDSIAFVLPEGPAVDTVAFEALVASLRLSWAEDGADGMPVEEALAAAAGLYRGEFLAGFGLPDAPRFDQWQSARRESLRLDYAWLLGRAFSRVAARGGWEEAAGIARRTLALDRYDEAAWRSLILALARSGRRGEALREYTACEDFLRAELSEGPDAETLALVAKIRGGELGAAEPAAGKSWAAGTAIVEPAAPAIPPAPRPGGIKTFVPRSYGPLVGRPRLFSLLDAVPDHGLVLVSAEAGFGKSTLVSEWARGSGSRVAWLSLDRDDNDAARFLLFLATALSTVGPGLGSEALEMLRAARPIPRRNVLEVLLAGIEGVGESLVLVLDDFHVITDREVLGLVEAIMETAPRGLRLILVSRTDPPLALARLRAQGRLVELRPPELRFTLPEAGEFFGNLVTSGLSPEDIAILEERTEGWIAGLKMAALSLRAKPDPHSFVAAFGGGNRHISDFLMEEVFEGQEPGTRLFLACAALPERFCAALCEALAGRSGGEAFLEALERGGLFLIPLDDERRWFRLHRLFGDLLLERLTRERGPEGIRDLHTRAAAWFLANGLPDEAIGHYLAADDLRGAGQAMVQATQSMVAQGLLSVVLRWMEALPPDLVRGWPELNFQKAKGLLFAGRLPEAEAAILDLEAALPGLEDKGRRRWVTAGRDAARAFIAFLKGDFGGAVAHSLAAVEGADPGDTQFLGGALWTILTIYKSASRWKEADAVFDKYKTIVKKAGDPWSLAFIGSEYAWGLKHQGRLRDADALYRDILAFAESRGAGAWFSLANLYSGLADLARERGEFERAAGLAEEAVVRAEKWRSPSDLANAWLTLAAVGLSRGEAEPARTSIAKARAIVEAEGTVPGLSCMILAQEARLSVLEGRGGGGLLLRLAEEAAPAPNFVEMLAVAACRLRLAGTPATGATVESLLDILDRLAAEGVRLGRLGRLVEIQTLRSLAYEGAGRHGEALAILGEILAAAEPEGFFSVFLAEGPGLTALLAEGLAAPGWKAPALRLASRLSAGRASPPFPPPRSGRRAFNAD